MHCNIVWLISDPRVAKETVSEARTEYGPPHTENYFIISTIIGFTVVAQAS